MQLLRAFLPVLVADVLRLLLYFHTGLRCLPAGKHRRPCSLLLQTESLAVPAPHHKNRAINTLPLVVRALPDRLSWKVALPIILGLSLLLWLGVVALARLLLG